jgi:hypothetical protein
LPTRGFYLIVRNAVVGEQTLKLSAQFDAFDLLAQLIGEKLQAFVNVQGFQQLLFE